MRLTFIMFYLISIKLMTQHESILFTFGFPEAMTLFWQELISWLTPVYMYNFSNLTYTSTHNVVFWPLTRPKMPFRVMHWKEVTHSSGSYERKSHGWKLADEMGWAKKSHDTLIDWCTGRELPLNCMTVISAWWRLNMRFQRSSGRSSGRWTII